MRDLKKSTNSLETRRIRKILSEEDRLGISPNSESETEEVDLQKELYPLGHYINNREEMIEQMFSIIRGAKLKKMLPPILKDVPFDELRADCLIHLLGMSKKRIRAILDGREINSSSGSESHSDSSTTPSKKQKVDLKPFVIKQEGCSDISDNSEEVVLVDPDLDFLNVVCSDKKKADSTEGKKSKRKQKKKDLDKKHKRIKTTKILEQASESDSVENIDSTSESASENETETQVPKEGKTLLEILELEMRARAIRALLNNDDTPEGEEPQKATEGQNPINSKDKSKKQLKEGTTEKVTPTKNFRKKKRKSDDVIVIAPKLVTIDLTDEYEQTGIKNNMVGDNEENAPSSSQNNNVIDDPEEVSERDLSQTNHIVSGKTIVPIEESSRTKDHDTSVVVASCSLEKKSKSESLDKTNQLNNGKSSWAQRWLESKEVKKVVSTSKICGNIRKKIKIANLAKKKNQSQIEVLNTFTAPNKTMEGSVDEYELLSKSKTTNNITDEATKASVSPANKEATFSEADLIETPTADQVQDITSTKAENCSTHIMEGATSGLKISEGKTTCKKIQYDKSNITGIATNKFDCEIELLNTNDEETVRNCASDGEVERSESKCLNKNADNSLENDSTETRSNPESMNKMGNKGSEEEDGEFPLENLVETSIEKEPHTTKPTCPDKQSDSHSHLYIEHNMKGCETVILLAEQTGSNSKTSDDDGNELDFDSTSNTEPNLENKSLQITTKAIGNNQTENDMSKVSETKSTVVSSCSAKSNLELNEPETLEIDITEEDRDIEDAVEESNEQNQSRNSKDSIVVID